MTLVRETSGVGREGVAEGLVASEGDKAGKGGWREDTLEFIAAAEESSAADFLDRLLPPTDAVFVVALFLLDSRGRFLVAGDGV